MKKDSFTLVSECDGLPLSVAVFSPDDAAKGIVQFSHGMAEHKERYYPFMEHLTEHGYVTVINDHRGHGGSVKSADDLGYFYDETSDNIVEDLHQVTLYAKEHFKGLPVFLFGHSMGSLVVRKYIKKYDDEIEKLVVCGSPSKNPLIGLALALVKMQKAAAGDKHRSGLINALAFGTYNKNIKNPISRTAWISASEENVRAYDEDDLCGYVFTLNGFKNLFLLMREVYEPQGWLLKNKSLPIFFIAGREDPVIAGEKKWLESQEFLRSLGYSDVKGKLYNGLRHEILNEAPKEQVYADVLAFFEE